MVRLRQVAIAAQDLSSAEAALQGALGVPRCYQDPNVGLFGLHNALFAVGDQFLEIVSPIEPGTTAGRLLEKRGGDCGYMVLFQVDVLTPVEPRLAAAGVRVVFDADAGDIRGLHLHPKDVPRAIVSIDAATDPADWPWAGPAWRDHVDTTTVRSIVGIDVAVEDPDAVAGRWAEVLGIERDKAVCQVDDATIRFVRVTPDDRRQGITAIDLATSQPQLAGTSQKLLGVTLRLVATPRAVRRGGGRCDVPR